MKAKSLKFLKRAAAVGLSLAMTVTGMMPAGVMAAPVQVEESEEVGESTTYYLSNKTGCGLDNTGAFTSFSSDTSAIFSANYSTLPKVQDTVLKTGVVWESEKGTGSKGEEITIEKKKIDAPVEFVMPDDVLSLIPEGHKPITNYLAITGGGLKITSNLVQNGFIVRVPAGGSTLTVVAALKKKNDGRKLQVKKLNDTGTAFAAPEVTYENTATFTGTEKKETGVEFENTGTEKDTIPKLTSTGAEITGYTSNYLAYTQVIASAGLYAVGFSGDGGVIGYASLTVPEQGTAFTSELSYTPTGGSAKTLAKVTGQYGADGALVPNSNKVTDTADKVITEISVSHEEYEDIFSDAIQGTLSFAETTASSPWNGTFDTEISKTNHTIKLKHTVEDSDPVVLGTITIKDASVVPRVTLDGDEMQWWFSESGGKKPTNYSNLTSSLAILTAEDKIWESTDRILSIKGKVSTTNNSHGPCFDKSSVAIGIMVPSGFTTVTFGGCQYGHEVYTIYKNEATDENKIAENFKPGEGSDGAGKNLSI